MRERTTKEQTADHQHARSWFDHPCSVWRCECGAPLLRDVREQYRLEPSGTTGPAEAPKHYCTGDGCRACLDAMDAPVAGPADAGSHETTERITQVIGYLAIEAARLAPRSQPRHAMQRAIKMLRAASASAPAVPRETKKAE